MPRLMEKQDWMQTVANVGVAEGVWCENIVSDGDTVSLPLPGRGSYQVILVKIDAPRQMATKHPGQMSFDGDAARAEFLSVGISECPLTSANAAEADSLELFHSDPFDRMLLAQAKSKGIKIMSHDKQFPQYGDFVIHV